MSLALLDDTQEVIFQRRRRMADGVQLAAVLAQHFLQLAAQIVGQGQIAGPQLDAAMILQKRLHFAIRLQFALIEDGDAIASVLHVFQAMTTHDDRFAQPAQIADQIFHPTSAKRIEAGGRLIEDDEIGIVDERLRQADALAHALGILAEDAFAIGLESDFLDQLLGLVLPLRGRQIEQPAVKVESFLGVEEAIKIRFFRQIADAFVFGHVGGGLAEDEGFAIGGIEQTEQQFDGRRLAGAIGTEQTEDFALTNLHVEGAEGGLFLPAPKVAVDLG